jgi:hypothetical protein
LGKPGAFAEMMGFGRWLGLFFLDKAIYKRQAALMQDFSDRGIQKR